MNDLIKLVSSVASGKLWLGIIVPAWLLMENHIDSDDFSLIAGIAIGGMALVDFGRALTGNTLEGWRVNVAASNPPVVSDLEVLPKPNTEPK